MYPADKNPDFRKILKVIVIGFGIFVAVFAYVFLDSRFESKNKVEKTAEAYGVDSLTYEAEPIMEIRVWQRNDKEFSDYPDKNTRSSFFYNIIPLTLRVGESVETSYDRTVNSSLYYAPITFDILYDGDITGSYTIVAHDIVTYSGKSNKIPSSGVDKNALTNNDATFSGNREITVAVEELAVGYLVPYVDPTSTNSIAKTRMRNLENDGIDWEEHYVTENFFEAYPEESGMESEFPTLKQYKRLIMTTYLTVNAMHSTKQDVPVATAVLEISTTSCWFGKLSDSERAYVYSICEPTCYYTTVKVVSYEQSAFLAME